MRIGNRHFDFDRNKYVMGILNVTPDSFSDGGLFLDPEKALEQALRLEEEGADIIDVGGESTRPGADPVSAEEELQRVLPVIKKIVPRLKCPVSIDTQKADVARASIEEGVSLVNDVSALTDPGMFSVLQQSRVPSILMHKRGEPKNMQKEVFYQDVVQEVKSYLAERVAFAVANGLEGLVLADPGIGFGKRFEDNQNLIDHLDDFASLRVPLVFGVSRKSFVKKIFGDEKDAVKWGSVLTALLAAQRGAAIVRVHDVRETREAFRLANFTLAA